jgi:3-phenylpropionate/trans-cinnamate dioxygenase ferredoxin subunit
MKKSHKTFVVCKTGDIPAGGRKIIEVEGKSIGLFNVKGEFYALLNYCPHTGAELCRGPITGTTLPVDDYEYVYGYEGELIRCAWHGWEFKIATGESLVDPKIRAKRYRVTVENDEVVLHI